jgi:hypothetical protein
MIVKNMADEKPAIYPIKKILIIILNVKIINFK